MSIQDSVYVPRQSYWLSCFLLRSVLFTEKVCVGSLKQAHKLLAKLIDLHISKVVDNRERLR